MNAEENLKREGFGSREGKERIKKYGEK